jgi:hypothetical protein
MEPVADDSDDEYQFVAGEKTPEHGATDIDY